MAAGEYGSVSTQRDAELADIAKERRSLENHPEAEQAELVAIYRKRGFPDLLAAGIAEHLHRGDPLAAHLRDELGLDENELARLLESGAVSGAGLDVFEHEPAVNPRLLAKRYSPDKVRAWSCIPASSGARSSETIRIGLASVGIDIKRVHAHGRQAESAQ